MKHVLVGSVSFKSLSMLVLVIYIYFNAWLPLRSHFLPLWREGRERGGEKKGRDEGGVWSSFTRSF